MKYSKILLEDINDVLHDKSIPWEKFKDSSVLITGATGMIGRGCVRILAQLNFEKNYNIQIYAMGRNPEKGRRLEVLQGVKFIQADISNPLEIEFPVEYIIHCAAITKSSEMVSNPIGVIETEILGSKNILEIALKNKVKGFLYASSMESYGLLDLSEVKEADQGYIDLTSPRSSYPMCKRMVELLCNCYYAQHQLRTKVVRLGMVFGAGENFMNDNRIWAQFARCIINNEPIELHTTGHSTTSFTYLPDALKGIFLTLLSNSCGEVYNVAASSYMIKEFAECIADNFNLQLKMNVPDDIEKLGYAKEFQLALNSDKLKALGWNPQIIKVEEMIRRVIEEFQSQNID